MFDSRRVDEVLVDELLAGSARSDLSDYSEYSDYSDYSSPSDKKVVKEKIIPK